MIIIKQEKTKNEKVKKDLLNPQNDYVFKRIFGHQGNESIAKSFISAVLNQNITDVVLESDSCLPKDMLDDKVGILDIKVKIDNHINCDVEMQVVDKKNIEKRILFYCSKMYAQSITAGKDYLKLEKSIAILISNYELDSLKYIKKYVSKWNLREEDYKNVILTDDIEIVIIELPKFKKFMNNTALADWVKFIINPKVIDMNNEEVKKAKEVLDELSQDEHARRLAELREKYIMDQKATEAAGYDKGYDKGFESGTKKRTLELAKNLKSKGIDINIISETTGLSIDEINKL